MSSAELTSPTRLETVLDLLAHDLRNDLAVIVGSARLLAGTGDELADQTLPITERLAETVDRIIEFARTATRAPALPSDEPVDELVSAAIQRAQRRGLSAIVSEVTPASFITTVRPVLVRVIADCIALVSMCDNPGINVSISCQAANDASTITIERTAPRAPGDRDLTRREQATILLCQGLAESAFMTFDWSVDGQGVAAATLHGSGASVSS